MIDSGEQQRRAYSFWLRTGRRVRVAQACAIETKYNHWHDPENGQFTFARGGGQGGGSGTLRPTSDGAWGGSGFTGGGGGSGGGAGASATWRGRGFTGGGGGSFGGAGASGNWGIDPKPQADRSAKPRASAGLALPRRLAPIFGRAARSPTAAPAFQTISRNGYSFEIDSSGRTRSASGTLRLTSISARSRKEQLQAGGSDRRPTDHGGHYIGVRFDGPTAAFNHFAQDANFNRRGYAALEKAWAADVKRGKRVVVKITPLYDGPSKRPAIIMVEFNKDDHKERRRFPNEQEARHGK